MRRNLFKFEQAALLVVLSGLCVALVTLFAKIGLRIPSVPLLVFSRFFVAFLILLPLFIYKKSFSMLKLPKRRWNYFLRAFFVIVAQYSLFYYLTRASLLNANMLFNSAPIYIPILSAIFLRHHVGKITWMCTVIGLIGIACVIKPDKGIFDPFSLWGVVSGIAVAFSQILFGESTGRAPIHVNLLYFYGLAALYAVLLLMGSEQFTDHDVLLRETHIEGFHWGFMVMIALGLGTMSIGNQVCRGFAYRIVKPPHLSPFLYSSVVFAGLFDWGIFNRTPDFLSIIGFLLIFLSTFIKWLTSKHLVA